METEDMIGILFTICQFGFAVLLLMKLKNIMKRKMKLYRNQSKGKNSNTKTVIDSDGKVKLPGLLQKPTNSKKPVKYG
jgi:hypothetical protein